ncbi:hypothetical protein [Corynebacterium glutamicum]|nr:hypothetical protein [Corynebacterium glutamicum]
MSNQGATQKAMLTRIDTGEKETATSPIEQWWAWFQSTGLQITGAVLKD